MSGRLVEGNRQDSPAVTLAVKFCFVEKKIVAKKENELMWDI